jgi:hypothetical protein
VLVPNSECFFSPNASLHTVCVSSIYLYVCLTIRLSVYSSVIFSVYLYVHLFIHLLVHLFLNLSVHLSTHCPLSVVFPSVCPLSYLSVAPISSTIVRDFSRCSGPGSRSTTLAVSTTCTACQASISLNIFFLRHQTLGQIS